MRNLPITAYIAINNPHVAQTIIHKYGMEPATSIDDLIAKCRNTVAQHGKPAEDDFLAVHPDLTRLQSYLYNHKKFDAPEVKKSRMADYPWYREYSNCSGGCSGGYSNCSGCGGACGGKPAVSNTDGPDAPVTKVKEYMPALLVCTSLIVAITIIVNLK